MSCIIRLCRLSSCSLVRACMLQIYGLPSTISAGMSSASVRPLHSDVIERQAADAKKIFQAGIDAVLPTKMVGNHLSKVHGDELSVNDQVYPLEKNVYIAAITDGNFRKIGNELSVNGQVYPLKENVYIAAFGKAVSGMVSAAESVLGEHLVKGVASVPVGMREALTNAGRSDMWPSSGRIEVIEGAAHNMPDDNSMRAALKIEELAGSLTREDIFLVLISGGGSALLSAPRPPITLEQKHTLTRLISTRGASIQELNTVRSRISLLKGGKLASLANTEQVISLILSDVIGDPLDLIACGPTAPSQATTRECMDILDKYTTPGEVPDVIVDVISRSASEPPPLNKLVNNVIVGSNVMAVDNSQLMAESLGYTPVVLSTSISGEACMIGRKFAELSDLCSKIYKSPMGDTSRAVTCMDLVKSLNASGETCQTIVSLVQQRESVCLIGAGETTVMLSGNGKGGRNQEMALSWAVAMETVATDASDLHITFFSGGTDGQDGPTDAAGAWAYPKLTQDARAYNSLSAAESLEANDSYTFFSKFRGGNNLVKTGLTGTNVMDIQVLLMKPT